MGSQDRYFKYDSLSRLIRERQVEQDTNSNYNLSDPLTGNSSWTRKIDYNSSSLVTDAYDARSVHTTLSYDGLNRVTQISYSDSTPTAHYYYDSQTLPTGAPSTSAPDYYSRGYSAGRLVAMTYGSGATGNYFAYDNMGRVNMQFQLTGSTPTKYKLTYGYNYLNELTSETYPSGRALTYAYDEGGRLSSVSDGTTTFANSFTFAPHGGLSSETWGNTSVHTMTYNRRLQASQAKLSLGSTVLQQYDYGYGEFNTGTGAVDTSKNNGQIGKITGTIGTTTQWLQGFQYDELGRLKNVAEYQSGSMSSQTYSQGYTFDRYGNRFQSANTTLGLPAVSSSEINAGTNRFINSGSTPTTYDAAGNITSDTKFRGMNYSYDANGRMTFAETTNHGVQQTSIHDCAGQRVQTSVTADKTTTTRTMVYDIFGQDVADYSGSSGSTLERENIYRGGQLLATYEAGSSSLKYVLTDIQGSTRAIMNNSGGSSSVVARHDYLPFGEEIGSGTGLRTGGQGYGATDTNRWKYGLTERDDTTGLDHTWWRKYDNLSGRWTSPDPYTGSMVIGDPQTFDRYSYTQNDPMNAVDPSGLCTFNIFLNFNGNLDPGQQQAMRGEIARIFAGSGQAINFVNSTQGADYSLSVMANAPSTYNGVSLSSNAVGVTGFSGASVYNTGSVFIDRLTYFATLGAANARAFGQNSSFLGIGLARAGAHEIGHFLFQQNFDSGRIKGVMHAGFNRDEWFSPNTAGLFFFNPLQRMQMNRMCEPLTTTSPSFNTQPVMHPIIGGVGGGFGGGGGYPGWWYSMWTFLDWVNSIRFGRVTVTAIPLDDPV